VLSHYATLRGPGHGGISAPSRSTGLAGRDHVDRRETAVFLTAILALVPGLECEPRARDHRTRPTGRADVEMAEISDPASDAWAEKAGR